jgi:hypothetical protein
LRVLVPHCFLLCGGEEVITSRFPEVVVKKVEKEFPEVCSRAEAKPLRKITGQGLMLKNARTFFRV